MGETTKTHEGEEEAPAGEPRGGHTMGHSYIQEQILNALWADTLLHRASGRASVNPIGRGTARDLRHQGMGHSADKPMQMHESDRNEAALRELRELEQVIGNEEEIKMKDENNDAGSEVYLEEEEVAYSARDEVRYHYMLEDLVHIEQRDEQIATEAYYFNEMLDFMLEAPLIIHHSKPKSYRQRTKSILGKRLEQLRIKVEPKEEKEATEKIKAPAETVLSDRIGNNLPLSKWNKSRASASFARRLLILIRSHLRKKGL